MCRTRSTAILAVGLLTCIDSAASAPVSREVSAIVAARFVSARQLDETVLVSTQLKRCAFRHDTAVPQSADVVPVTTKDGNVLFRVVDLSSEGFVILSADDRLSPVLGYSVAGRFPPVNIRPNVLLDIATWDVERRLEYIQSGLPAADMMADKNRGAWKILAENAADDWLPVTDAIWGPWISTDWHQHDHFNRYCPLRTPAGTSRRLVGCVATAMAQVINYWEYPQSVVFDGRPWPFGDAYLSWSFDWPWLYIDSSADTYDFPSLEELNDALSSITYSGNWEEEAYLSFAAGVSVYMRYGEDSSAASATTVASALRRTFGYGSAEADRSRVFNIWARNRDRVVENMKRGWPVILGVKRSRWTMSGHTIVVDGYDASTGFFHLNLGWSGWGNAWYDLPDITDPPSPREYAIVAQVVHGIAPFQGWSQWGADVRNTFTSPYDAPATQPDRKWEVTVPAGLNNHGFDDLVVGTGGEIYASVSPYHMGAGDHPFVCVVDPQGSQIQRRIEIIDANLPIDFLAQSSDGSIYFATGSSNVDEISRCYRLDPRTAVVTRIFEHTAPDEGIVEQPLKVDSDGRVYLVVDGRTFTNGAALYALQSNGNIEWVDDDFPVSTGVYRSAIGVDEERNRVYLTYYNHATERSYLVSNTRLTGNRVFTYPFPGTHRSSAMAGAAQVLSNGNVIVGCRTALYCISPQGIKLWDAPFGDIIMGKQAAIGNDGTIYSRFGQMISASWHSLFLRAITRAGIHKWDLEIAVPDSEYDNIGEIYSSRNGIILVSYSLSDVPRLAAVVDEGGGGRVIWDVPYGGRIAFGPSETIYLIPRHVEASIYAISTGERGDPNGLGMDFRDNIAPDFPFNPSPPDGATVEGTTVQLSWFTDDADGHDLTYSVSMAGIDPEDELAILPIADRLTEASLMLNDLQPGTGYLWSITVTDGQAVTEGPTWSFKTESAPDCDADGVPDETDNCTCVANPSQCDSDDDGIGNHCDPDLTGDGVVGIPDFNGFRACFESREGDANFDPACDFDCDGVVGSPDFNTLRTYFGGPPGGTDCLETHDQPTKRDKEWRKGR